MDIPLLGGVQGWVISIDHIIRIPSAPVPTTCKRPQVLLAPVLWGVKIEEIL
jgi:hypothetical protein